MMEFPVSGIETYWWLPPLTAFIISMLASVGGLSGAFLLLPFQVSILGYAGPGASSTNLLFNILAIPGGVYRHCREKRMVWPLAWVIILGTVPGMFIGAVVRVRYLPEAGAFKIFAGLVLLYLALKLVYDIVKSKNTKEIKDIGGNKFLVTGTSADVKAVRYEFNGIPVIIPTVPVLGFSFIVGIVGGAYGIGGGAIIVPFLVARYAVPVHTLAGAALFSTFVASIAGVGCYFLTSLIFEAGQHIIIPDWHLGLMLGVGGFAGIYIGSRIQRFLPARLIKIIIAVSMLFIAFRYLILR